MKILLYIWVFFIPFSHAPTYIHPLISFPALTTTLIIFISMILMIKNKDNSKQFTYIFLFLFLFILLIQIISIENLHPKYFSFFLAFLWFFLAYTTLNFYSKIYRYNFKIFMNLLLITTIITFVYEIIEVLAYINYWDFVNWLPRYDRVDYRYSSPLFSFRARAFNYESANLGSFYNIVMPLLIFYFKRYKISLFLIWIVGILLTLSSLHISLMVIFFILIISINTFKMLKFKKISVFAIISFLIIIISSVYLFNNYFNEIVKVVSLILAKAMSFITGEGTASGNIRNNLLIIGLDNLSNKPVLGYGFAGFYLFNNSGLNNFYLHLLVQVGIIFTTLIIAIFILMNFKIIKRLEIYLIYPFIVVLITLIFIGDFWLPQFFLPIVYYNLYTMTYKKYEV